MKRNHHFTDICLSFDEEFTRTKVNVMNIHRVHEVNAKNSWIDSCLPVDTNKRTLFWIQADLWHIAKQSKSWAKRYQLISQRVLLNIRPLTHLHSRRGLNVLKKKCSGETLMHWNLRTDGKGKSYRNLYVNRLIKLITQLVNFRNKLIKLSSSSVCLSRNKRDCQG